MSNHISDANKSVCEAPRTNTYLTAILDADGFVDQSNCPQRWVNHSRELERELNAANESLRKLNIHALNLAARIKRLEEAGDEIIWAFCPASVSMMTERESDALKLWIKAKEDKP